jgi:hypothetical protein
MEQEIILEMSRLLGKSGLGHVMPGSTTQENSEQLIETALINLRSLAARYDKNEALDQVQWLMNTYNIQIEELMDRIVA